MQSIALAVIVAMAVVVVAWRGVSLYRYGFHKKDL
jgi:hypothetical protein